MTDQALTPEQYGLLLKVASGMRNGFHYYPEMYGEFRDLWEYPYFDDTSRHCLDRDLSAAGRAAMRKYEAKHDRA